MSESNFKSEIFTAEALLEAYQTGRRNFMGANLMTVNLSHADLKGANLSYADLNAADLSHANLRGVDLSYA
nr:pentapeptide repeat-containing protein [Chamaesiphon sp. OTE_75_metabat_556]